MAAPLTRDEAIVVFDQLQRARVAAGELRRPRRESVLRLEEGVYEVLASEVELLDFEPGVHATDADRELELLRRYRVEADGGRVRIALLD